MAGPVYRITIHGLDKHVGKVKASASSLLTAMQAAIYIEAEEIMTAAKKQTPVDHGNLRASGHVQIPSVSETGSVRVEIGFGGPAGSGNVGDSNKEDVGYAVYVHENLTARHTVGNAKFLEIPLRERMSGMTMRLAERVKRRLQV